MIILYVPLIFLLPLLHVHTAPVAPDIDDISASFDSDVIDLDDTERALASDKDLVLYFDPDQRSVVEDLAQNYDDVTVDGKSRRKRATIIVVGDTTYYIRRKKPRRKFRPSPLLG